MKKTIKRFSPPGYEKETRRCLIYTMIAILAGSLDSCRVLIGYYTDLDFSRIFGDPLKSFTEYMHDYMSTIVFTAGVFAMLLLGLTRLFRFYRDGSYMTMKRLSNPREMAERAFVFPLAGALLIAAAGWLVTICLYTFYLKYTPAQLLPPVTW